MNRPRVNLVYFQRDLRIHDHPGLFKASTLGLPVIAVYLYPIQESLPTTYGWMKTGKYRWQFLFESLQDLKLELLKFNIPLFIYQQSPTEVGKRLQTQVDVDHVFASHEPGFEETSSLKAFLLALGEPKIIIHDDRCLLHPEDYPWLLKDLPQRFTDARIRIENQIHIRPCLELPQRMLNAPILLKHDTITPQFSPMLTPWMRGGETQAKAHLQHYFFTSKQVLSYKLTRNNMLAFKDSSKLSPALALGLLSPRYIYWQLKKVEETFGKNPSTYWLWFELLWRDYFYYLHRQHGNRFFYLTGIQNRKLSWIENPDYIQAVLKAKTGYPLVDANLTELYSTGWMSNRGRQNVASFLTKILRLDWRWGASLFEHYLIDYDVSSNYGNWQYLSGVGVDPREERIFNVSLQAKKYDPDASYIKHWLPVLKHIPSPTIFEPWQMNALEMAMFQCEIGKDYPAPIINDPRVQIQPLTVD
jgi:deoxyribodipyrimidine photo-lyase